MRRLRAPARRRGFTGIMMKGCMLVFTVAVATLVSAADELATAPALVLVGQTQHHQSRKRVLSHERVAALRARLRTSTSTSAQTGGEADAEQQADARAEVTWMANADYPAFKATWKNADLNALRSAYYSAPSIIAGIGAADEKSAAAKAIFPHCTDVKTGFCLYADPKLDPSKGNRLTLMTFRAGWIGEESPGGEAVMPVMCAEIGSAKMPCLGGNNAEPWLVSGHVINHKLGGGSKFIDWNPLNFFPQDAYYNVFPSAWTNAEHVIKRIMRGCGNAKPACYASARISLEYRADALPAGAGPFVQPETNPFMPLGGEYSISATKTALQVYIKGLAAEWTDWTKLDANIADLRALYARESDADIDQRAILQAEKLEAAKAKAAAKAAEMKRTKRKKRTIGWKYSLSKKKKKTEGKWAEQDDVAHPHVVALANMVEAFDKELSGILAILAMREPARAGENPKDFLALAQRHNLFSEEQRVQHAIESLDDLLMRSWWDQQWANRESVIANGNPTFQKWAEDLGSYDAAEWEQTFNKYTFPYPGDNVVEVNGFVPTLYFWARDVFPTTAFYRAICAGAVNPCAP